MLVRAEVRIVAVRQDPPPPDHQGRDEEEFQELYSNTTRPEAKLGTAWRSQAPVQFAKMVISISQSVGGEQETGKCRSRVHAPPKPQNLKNRLQDGVDIKGERLLFFLCQNRGIHRFCLGNLKTWMQKRRARRQCFSTMTARHTKKEPCHPLR